MTNVLICGGRNFQSHTSGFRQLDAINRAKPFGLVITGGALGADTVADDWANQRGIPRVIFPANWNGDGQRAAGPKRNQRMLDLMNVKLVVAFPGGTGTADMVRRAKLANIGVIQI